LLPVQDNILVWPNELPRFKRSDAGQAFSLSRLSQSGAGHCRLGRDGKALATVSNQSILAYFSPSQSITIDMSEITGDGGAANCNGFNPLTGEVTINGNISKWKRTVFPRPKRLRFSSVAVLWQN